MQTAGKGNSIRVDLVVNVHMKRRPINLKIGYSSTKGKLVDASSPFASGITEGSISLQWASFPDTSLTIPISFSIPMRDSVGIREHIEASFMDNPVPVTVKARQPSSLIYRSYFVRDGIVAVH
jgi:hypothetical protein